MKISRFIDDTLDLLFTPICVACGELSQGRSLCGACNPAVPITGPLCDHCGVALSQPLDRCGDCLRKPPDGMERIRSLFWLNETSLQILHKVKYQSRRELLRTLETPVRQTFRKFWPHEIVLVPIPLHSDRLIARTFNQAAILTKTLARSLETARVSEALVKVRATDPQSTLSEKQRRANLRASYQWRGEPYESILLIDDVYTTGSTLRECARTARKAGVNRIYGLTFWRTPKW